MQICFFSDQQASNFLPLTLTRPNDDLRVGIITIREKWTHLLKADGVLRISETNLRAVFEPGIFSNESDVLFINNRTLPSYELLAEITKLKVGQTLVFEDIYIAAKTNCKTAEEWIAKGDTNFRDLEPRQMFDQVNILTHYWDLLTANGSQIKADATKFGYKPIHKTKFASHCVSMVPENILVAEDAVIEPGCTIIGTDGIVFIGSRATIETGSILRGPVAICEHATVKMGARIFGGSTIGPYCKVGGEVNNVIFHSYSNKAHEGFIGNSVVGQWCNFGAGTNSSNLKNNYSPVKLPHWETGEVFPNAPQFFGAVFGDHSKTAIGTTLNTGTICGVSSNIFNSGFPPKKIGSFSWLGNGKTMKYELDKALDTMRTVMKRRNVELSDEYAQMMTSIHHSEYPAGS